MTTEAIALKKMSLKEICEIPREVDAKEYFKVRAKTNDVIATIVGDVSGYGAKATQFKDATFFIGEFFARNEENGKLFESRKLYLPTDTADELRAAFDGRGDANAKIEIKLQVKVVEHPSQGYTYITVPLRDPESINRRAQLLANVQHAPRLAAPKPASKKSA